MTRENTFLGNACLCLLVASSLLFASCKKNGGGKNDDGGEENTFTINGTKYKATQISYIEELNILQAERITPTSGLNEVESLSITFSDDEFPKASGSFDIVNDPYSPNDHNNNNQVSVLVTTFPHMTGNVADYFHYYPKLDPVQHVTVTLGSNNKLNVKFSNLTFEDENGETTTISANITQP